MNYLNDLYKKSCKPSYKIYERKINQNITLIYNFFENFNEAKDFLTSREKWKCIPDQSNSKPGMESLFPNWVGKYLIEKFIIDNQIHCDPMSFDIVCNLFYQTPTFCSLTNTGLFPHYDMGESFDGFQKQICLINLNDVPISTRFYSFDDAIELKKNDENKWNRYFAYITSEYFKYCENKKIPKIITRKQLKHFFEENEQKVRFKLIDEIWYEPNQCIIYPANILHSANVTNEFSINNPRTSIRITFDKKIDNFLQNNYNVSQLSNIKNINAFYK